METTNAKPIEPEKLEKAAKEVGNTLKMIAGWAQKQGADIIRQMELKRAAPTLSIHWPKIRQGWLGGFVSGVHAGFQLGYQTANKLSDTVLEQSGAVLAGNEAEFIEAKNAEIKELFGQAIGEASMCWSETPKGVFDSSKAEQIVNRLFARFATPLPEKKDAQAETDGQERLPGL